MDACSIGQFSTFAGEFELTNRLDTTIGETPRFKLGLVRSLLGADFAARITARRGAAEPELQRLLRATPGESFSMALELPDAARVPGRVLVLGSYSTVFRTFADANGQGVFVETQPGLYENSMVYSAPNAVALDALLAMAQLGARSDSADPNACPQPTAPGRQPSEFDRGLEPDAGVR